ncbi:hypothetical protein FHR71_003930 [Methylobacterium sp. RAS18]|nr:hypothetical protein [Methylobacterium sp. RAS18]
MLVQLDRDLNGERVTATVEPSLGAFAAEINAQWGPGLVGEEDEKWVVARIAGDSPAGSEFTHVVLRAEGRCQGWAVIENTCDWRSGDLDQKGSYLAWTAAAPWHRKDETGRRVDDRFTRLKPVGLILLAIAILVSRRHGHGGRLALHSLPRPEPWYRQTLLGLVDLGLDFDGEAYYPYFEADEAVTTGFIERTGILSRISL